VTHVLLQQLVRAVNTSPKSLERMHTWSLALWGKRVEGSVSYQEIRAQS